MSDVLTSETLERAVAGECAAIRAVTRLEPAGGRSDKIFPPTYVKEGHAATRYAFEDRLIDGVQVPTVLLDSVASQANRFEEALLESWRRGDVEFPVVLVDFKGIEGLADLDEVTSLQAPHRIADAILRDSLLDDRPFRHTDVGRAITESRPNHSTGMYRYCPSALVFGVWDSTGPKGGMGAKYQRCLVSEIVGINAVAGVKASSRIDPLGIEKRSGPVFEHEDPDHAWTVDEKEARKQKGKPVLYHKKGTPAEVNHGNIPPAIDGESGGVTIEYALQTTVLSLAGLRRLRFVEDCAGNVLPADGRLAAEGAARTALAALALAAVVLQREDGYDLRSRSLLVPTQPLQLELVSATDGSTQSVSLDRQAAAALLRDAANKAADAGLEWEREPIRLVPAPKLVDLVRRSRELTQAGDAAEG